jgi:hypothetical protein
MGYFVAHNDASSSISSIALMSPVINNDISAYRQKH